MLKYADIRDSLVDLIKERAGLSQWKVFFNFVDKAEGNYVFVSLRPRRNDIGWGMLERDIRVDFQFHSAPDGFGEIRASDYYEAIDALDAATLHSVPIGDRHIVVYDTSTIIFDKILTYSFVLSFSDYWDEMPFEERGKLMKHLHMNWEEQNGVQHLQRELPRRNEAHTRRLD